MKNKGFTLIEIMAVIVILLLIILLAFPSLINVLKSSSSKIDAATEALIINAAKDEIEQNKNDYPRTKGNIYCIKIKDLIDKGHLISELKEGTDSGDIDKNRYIKIEVIESEDLKEIEYKYQLCKENESCEENLQ